jgi:predicted RNA-binding protein with PUA-like domain
MAFWLFKEEPEHYSYADLERDGATTWDGISNALALKHLGQCRTGDMVLYYHTGKEKAVVGLAKVRRTSASKGQSDSGYTITVRPVRRLARPVTLAQIKADPALAGWDLLRLPRLSVVPVNPKDWERIQQMVDEPA